MDDRELLSDESGPATRESKIEVGTQVYVRDRVLGGWSEGYEVAEILDDGYCLRRLSDGFLVPEVFWTDDVRRERRKNPFRGIIGSYLDRRH
jgi:hypothetical protein